MQYCVGKASVGYAHKLLISWQWLNETKNISKVISTDLTESLVWILWPCLCAWKWQIALLLLCWNIVAIFEVLFLTPRTQPLSTRLESPTAVYSYMLRPLMEPCLGKTFIKWFPNFPTSLRIVQFLYCSSLCIFGNADDQINIANVYNYAYFLASCSNIYIF